MTVPSPYSSLNHPGACSALDEVADARGEPLDREWLGDHLHGRFCPSSDDSRRFATLMSGGPGPPRLTGYAAVAWWRKRRSMRVWRLNRAGEDDMIEHKAAAVLKGRRP